MTQEWLTPEEMKIKRLEAALEEAYRQIRLLAEIGTDTIIELGRKVDPAKRTYQPIIDRIKAMAK